MENQKVVSSDAAFRSIFVPVITATGVKITDLRLVNNGRHRFVRLSDGTTFCFIFKNSFFNTYSEQFEGQKRIGESINVDRLYWCISNKIDYIVFCYPDGKMYQVTPSEFKQFADENCTYRKVEIKDYRRNFNKVDVITETTASIEISKLKRFDCYESN